MTSSTNYTGARDRGHQRGARTSTARPVAQCTGGRGENAFSGINVAGTTCGGTPPPTGANKVANPGFESGATSWTQTTGVITNDAAKARAGSWLGWLDGYGVTHTDSLSQSVVIPAASERDAVVLAQGDIAARRRRPRRTTRSRCRSSAARRRRRSRRTRTSTRARVYVQKTLNMTPYVGKTVTLKVVGVEDSSLATSFFVDDFSVTTA